MNGAKTVTIVLSACIGIIISGTAMMVRGDFLGERAANEVEVRMEKLVIRSEDRHKEDTQQLRIELREMNNKLDTILERVASKGN